jgi:hypothetical protein
MSTVPSKNGYDPGFSVCSTSAQQICFIFHRTEFALQSAPCEPLADYVAWRSLGCLILSFIARAFIASTDRFNFAAIRRMDVLASIKDLRRSSSSGVHLLLVLLATGDRPSAISNVLKGSPALLSAATRPGGGATVL